MLVTPIGKITTIDASSITGAYPSGNGGTTLGAKEILRASVVKIDNQSDTPIVARVVLVQGLNPATGEPLNIYQQINIETFNYHDIIIKPAETLYIKKVPTQTTFDDPSVPTYADQPASGGETIVLRLAEGLTAGTGNVYASPVTIIG